MHEAFSNEEAISHEEDGDQKHRKVEAVARSRISRKEHTLALMQFARSVVDSEYKPNFQETFIASRNAILSVGTGILASLGTTWFLRSKNYINFSPPLPSIKRAWIPSAIMGVFVFQIANSYGRKRANLEFIKKKTPMGMHLAETIYDYRMHPERFKRYEDLSYKEFFNEVFAAAREKKLQKEKLLTNSLSGLEHPTAEPKDEDAFAAALPFDNVWKNSDDPFSQEENTEQQVQGYKSWEDIRKNR